MSRSRARLAKILEPIERDLAGLSVFDVDEYGQIRPVDDAAAIAQLLEEDRQRQDLEARGRRYLEAGRAAGAATKRVHDARRKAWAEESERLRRAGIENRWERARRIAAKFRTPDRPGYPSRRTVYEYLGRVEGRSRRRPVT